MYPSTSKTKLVWSLSQASFDTHTAKTIAQKLISKQLDAVRVTFTAPLAPSLHALRKSLFDELAQNKRVPTPEGLVPFLLSFVGRRAILKVPGGSRELAANEELEVNLSVADESSLLTSRLHSHGGTHDDDKGITILVSAPDMLSSLKPGSRLILSYGQTELEILALREVPSAAPNGQASYNNLCAQVRVDLNATVLNGMDVHSNDIPRDLFPLLPQDENAIASRFEGLADFVIIHGIYSVENLLDIKRRLLPESETGSRRHPSGPISASFKETNAILPPRLILKVDSATVLDALPALLPHVDGVFLSRSELGLSVHPNSLPIIQKEVIATCNQAAKTVIVASELMYSMRVNPNPTRAEVSDMTNAISDGADALVLAEEVTEGPHADLVADVSIDTIKSAEPFMEANWHRVPFNIANDDDAIAYGALQVAQHARAKAIVCLTEGGYTAMRLSSLRTPVDIIAVTYNKNIMRQLNLLRSVAALTLENSPPFDQVLVETKIMLHKYYGFQRGDRIVFVTLTASPVAARNSNLFTVQEID